MTLIQRRAKRTASLALRVERTRRCKLLTVSGRLGATAPTDGERRAKEQPLDEFDDALTVECFALAALDGEALLQCGAYEIVQQLSVHGGVERRQTSLGNGQLEKRLYGIRDLPLRVAHTPQLGGRLRLDLEIPHEAQIRAADAKRRLDDGARHLLDLQLQIFRRANRQRNLLIQRQADVQQDVVLALKVQVHGAHRHASGPGDLCDSRLFVSPRGEKLARGAENSLSFVARVVARGVWHGRTLLSTE